MEIFRFKVVRADGSHYFYVPSICYTLKDALYSGFYQSHKQGVREVVLYIQDRKVATFNH